MWDESVGCRMSQMMCQWGVGCVSGVLDESVGCWMSQ